jgi:hypothetical protein
VSKHQSILIYLLAFLVLSVALRIFNIIDFNSNEILSYAFILYGISVVYVSLGRNKRITLFFGSILFLIGIVLFVINNFDFMHPGQLLFPSLIFIIGISLLIVFFDNSSNIGLLVISCIFLFFGIIYTIFFGSISANLFLLSIERIVLKYWPVLIIILGIIFLIGRDK